MNATSLEERILDVFPGGDYGLMALLRLLDIVETTEVDTAAVECTESPRLLINREFVDRHAETPERLLMLILHELHHVLLGHTRLFPRSTPVDNLIFDAVINALLCRMLPGKAYTSFFTRFYRDDAFPECILRPAPGWNPAQPAPVPRGLEGDSMKDLRYAYLALYSPTGTDYLQLFNAMRTVVQEAPAVPLIGSHGEEMEELKGVTLETVRAIVEDWPQPPDPIRGRSFSDLLCEERVVRKPSNRETLRHLLRKVAGPGRTIRCRSRTAQPVACLSPVPTHDRKSVVLGALGVPQLLYRNETLLPKPEWRDRVHVYLDVSGSIGDLKGALYGAVSECAGQVHRMVHLFSTKVHDITHRQLREGVCRSTYGTSIECVARHMESNRVKRAVIITDGYVGRPGVSSAAVLADALVGVALTPGSNWRGDMQNFVRHWAELEGVGER